MAAGNPNYDALLSSTIKNYRRQFSDNLSRSFFLMYWLTRKNKKTERDGGTAIVVPLMYGRNTTVRSYDGYETLDTTPQEGLTAVEYPWKQVAGSVSISRKEERQNSGKSRMVALLDAKVRQAEISMRDKLNEMFFGDGTGNDSKDIFGLRLLVEDGAAWGTVAGIDRSDAANAWWRNQFIGTVGTAGMASARTLYNSSSRGNEHPDIGVTDQTSFERYEKALALNERFTDTETGDAGFQNLKFKGMVVGYDEQCPAGFWWNLNSDYLEYVVDSETDLINTDFVRPENQDAKVSQILLMANLTCSNSARQGLMNGITGTFGES